MCDGSPPQHMTAQVANSDSKWLCLLSVLSYSLKDRPVPVNKNQPARPRSCGNWELGIGYWGWEMGFENTVCLSGHCEERIDEAI